MIAEPTIDVWAASFLTDAARELIDSDESDDLVTDIDALHERAGRACYESWSRPNPATATAQTYIGHILEVGHESVLAHGTVTLYFRGVSRSFSHELVRSRFLAFSQVSQRYVPSGSLDWVCPPIDLHDERAHRTYQHLWDAAVEAYDIRVQDLERRLEEEGVSGTAKKKRAREAARAVLPNMTETRIVVTGNIRAWRDFIRLRWSEHADAEIDRVAAKTIEVLREFAPYSVGDLTRTT